MSLSHSEIEAVKSRGYKLLKKLSEGMWTRIYLTECMKSQYPPHKVMACKVIDKKKSERKVVKKFLPREVAILTSLSSPHCIQIYSIIDIQTKCFIFMRYAENGDLLDYLAEHGAVDESHARLWIRQLMLALKYLQSKRIAHRDIKCENILITSNFNAKLADFGFARYWVDDKGHETMSNTFCGSLSYAAPEVLKGRPYSPKYCDMWSMGVVFYIMSYLTKPFNNRKAGALLRQQMTGEVRFKGRSDGMELSSGAKEIIRRMLRPNMGDRATPEDVLRSEWMKEDPMLLRLVPDDVKLG